VNCISSAQDQIYDTVLMAHLLAIWKTKVWVSKKRNRTSQLSLGTGTG